MTSTMPLVMSGWVRKSGVLLSITWHIALISTLYYDYDCKWGLRHVWSLPLVWHGTLVTKRIYIDCFPLACPVTLSAIWWFLVPLTGPTMSWCELTKRDKNGSLCLSFHNHCYFQNMNCVFISVWRRDIHRETVPIFQEIPGVHQWSNDDTECLIYGINVEEIRILMRQATLKQRCDCQ